MSAPWDDLREALRRGPGPARALRQRGRVLDALEASSRPRLARLVALGAACALVGAIGAALLRPRPSPGARDAQGREVLAGAPLRAAAEPVELRFDEGSGLALLPGAEARVTALAADRVEVRLDEGRLDATVTPGTGRTWRYLAGDWAVRVTGTQLSVRWEPASGAFDVSVSRGSVEVTGPGLERPVAVRAGESLHRERQAAAAPSQPGAPSGSAERGPPPSLSATGEPAAPTERATPQDAPQRAPGAPAASAEHATASPEGAPGRATPASPGASAEHATASPQGATTPTSPGASAEHATASPQGAPERATPGSPAASGHATARPPAPPAAGSDQRRATASRPPRPAASEGAPAWRTALEAGHRREALDLFEPAPPAALADGDALALGDAARLEHRGELARRLLGDVLRHAGPDAAEAAFLLGRIEAYDERHPQAVAWFRRAVELAPDGPFAEQSRGRLLEALLQLSDAKGARAAAEDYLRRHPSGAWASLATRVAHAGDSGP